MERNLKEKVFNYGQTFKNEISDYIKNYDNLDEKFKVEFLTFIYDYHNLEINSEDFKKKKRIKNTIENFERCCALRCNNERCTRKKKGSSNFCGTHNKGTPYGTINEERKSVNKVEIWIEGINGISQYVDKDKNIYSTEDIMKSNENPRIIGTYK
tara:strand:- start:340 stop:804 length:465 start_codon:yes stop_codon:yes gene_type:complete